MAKRRLLSMGFLVLALVMFVAFHLLVPDRYNDTKGWEIWPDVWGMARNPKDLQFADALALAALMNFSFLIVVSPFLKNVWPKSRLAWWGAVICSGLAASLLWGVILYQGEIRSLRFGGWCLMLAPVMNFIGLLLAREKPPREEILSFEMEDSQCGSARE